MEPLKTRLAAVLVTFAVLAGASPAWALGTAANTSIDNRASVTYTVSTVPQTLIESSPAGNSNPGATNGADTSFLVDDRVDLTVVVQDVANVSVAPGQTAAVTTFRVTNTGNAIHDFRLTASDGGAEPFATPPFDSFDVAGENVRVEDGVTPGFTPAEDAGTFIDELAADGFVDVYILANIPALQVTNDLAVVTLTAVTADGATVGLGGDTTETAGPDTAAVDVVFGDTGTDATENAQSAYVVQTASLTITKTSAIISDPFNGTGANRKRIPGAVIEYTVTVANAGPATATSITVTDDLTTEIGAGTISFDLNGYGAGNGMQVNAPNIVGSPKALSNAADADEGQWNVTPNTMIVNGITLLTGENATVTYRVIITYP